MKILQVITLILVVVCIILFGAYMVYFSTGLPQSDDFSMMFVFLDRWGESNSFYEKYLLLTEQFLEHRMIAMKLTVLTIKGLFGRMNIDAVNFVGVTLWFGIIYLLFRAFRHTRLPAIAFAPVIFFAVNPGYGFDGLFWAATWMAFPWAIFLCLISFYFLTFHENKRCLIVAWIFAMLTLFSHGNGISAFVIGLLILVGQKKWRESLAWGLASALGYFLFFFNYVSAASSVSSPFSNLFTNTFYVLSSFGIFTGGAVYFPEHDHDSGPIRANNIHVILSGLILSFMVVGYAAWFFWQSWNNKKVARRVDKKTGQFLLFCICIGIFVIFTGGLMSCLRTNTHLVGGFAGRYHFYSVLLFAVVYLAVLCVLPKLASSVRFLGAVIAVTFVFCMGQYWWQTADISNRVRVFQAGLYNSRKNGKWMIYGDTRFWERGVSAYSNEKLWPAGSPNYKYPDVTIDPENSQTIKVDARRLSSDHLIDVENEEDNLGIHLRGDLFQIPMFAGNVNGTYLCLISGNKTFLYPCYQQRMGLRQFLSGQYYFKPEASVMLKKKWFPTGSYDLCLYVVNEHKRTLVNTGQNILIKAYPYED